MHKKKATIDTTIGRCGAALVMMAALGGEGGCTGAVHDPGQSARGEAQLAYDSSADAGIESDVEIAAVDQSLTVEAGSEEFPYIGAGYNSAQNTFLTTDPCLVVSTKWDTSKAISDGELKLEISQATLETDFGIKVNAKASYGLFSGGARAEFMRKSRTDARSLTYVHRFKATLGHQIHDEAKSRRWGVSPTDPKFYAKCGDHYTYGYAKGGAVYIAVQLDFATEEERQAFQASVEAQYAGVGAKGDVAAGKVSFNGRMNVSIFAHQEGGEVERLASVFSGTTNTEGLSSLDCGLGDFESCKAFVASANKYAAGTGTNDFQTNLRRSPGVTEYIVKPWTPLLSDVTPEVVPDEIQTKRAWLLAKIQKAADVDNRVQALIRAGYFGAKSDFIEDVGAIRTQNQKNIPIINAAVKQCFDNYGPGWAGLFCLSAADSNKFAEQGYKAIDMNKLEVPLKEYTLSTRADVVAERTPVPDLGVRWGNWGTLKPWKMCPAGTYATGYAIEVESSVGNNDDTAMNGLKLHCNNWEGSKASTVTVHDGLYGKFYSPAFCDHGAINGFNIKVESAGHEDCTAANDLAAVCASSQKIQAPGGMWYGDPQKNYTTCPGGTAVCGARVLYEDSQGGGDDTGLNNVTFACCAY